MAGQQIGLAAILDLSDWSKNVGKYTNDIGRMEKNTAGIGSRIGSSFQGIGKAVLGVSAAIGIAAGAAGAAIGAFAVGGIQKAANLEAQLSSIAATLNTTREQIAPLKDLIMNLALDPNLVVSTTEAAEAVENLARNGLSMQQILDGAAKSTVLLANATGADFGMAADIATDVMAQFNIEAENMGHAVDQIAGVTNLSKFTIDDYRLAIAQAGGVASSVGVSFEDFNTSIASTSTLFASGSDAGTSFKTFLTSLNPKSAEAASLMKTLGLNFFDAQGQMKSMADIAEELNRVMFDEVTFTSQVNNMTAEQIAQKKALESTLRSTTMELFKYQVGVNGVAQSEEDKIVSIDRLNRQHEAAMQAYSGLATSMGTTVSVTRELTEAERMQMAQTIFGSDAMRTAFGLAEAGAVIYTDVAQAARELGVSQEEVNKVIEGGVTQFEALQLQMAAIDAEQQAAERMRNFKGVIQILQGALEALQIMIGDAFLPVLTELAKMANDLVAAYGPALIKPFQDFGAAIGTFVAAIKDGQTPLDAFKTAMANFGETGTAIANGMIAASLAIGGFFVVVGMILEPIATAIGRFVEWKDVLIVLAGAVLSVVVPAIIGMITAMAPIILIVGGAILAVAALRTAWESDFLGIQTATTNAISAIQIAFEPFVTAIQTHGMGALQEIRNFASGTQTEFVNTAIILGAFRLGFESLFTALSEKVNEVLPAMKGHWDELGVGITAFAATLVAAQIPTLFTAIATAVVAAKVAIVAALATINLPLLAIAIAVAVLAAAWQGNWFGMRDAVAQFVEGSKRQWEQLKTELTTLKTVFETFQHGSARQWEQLGAEIRLFVSGSKRQWEELKKDVGGVKEFLTTFQYGSARQWEQLGAEISIFVSGSKRQWTELKSDLSGVGKTFTTFREGSVRQWKQLKAEIEAIDWYTLGSGIITQIWNGIDVMKALITGTFTSIVDTAQDKLVNPAVSWFTRGMDIVRNIRDGIVALATDLISRFGTMIANAVKKITDTNWVQLGIDIVQGLIRGIAQKAQDFIDKVKGMAQDAVDAVTGVLDMQSPSKVFFEIGQNIIRGWVLGMEAESRNLYQAINKIVANVYKLAAQAGTGAASSIGSTIGNLFSSSSAIVDELGRQLEQNNQLWMDLMNAGLYDIASPFKARGNRMVGLQQEYARQQKNYELLKQQADLIQAIRDAGGNPAQVLAGVNLGFRQNPINRQLEFDAEGMTNAINKMTEMLNSQLLKSVQAAAQDVEETIGYIARLRKPVDELERAFNVSGLTSVDDYRLRLGDLDEQIRQTEESLRAFGDETVSATNMPGTVGTISIKRSSVLRAITNKRNELLAEYETFLRQQSSVEEAMKSIVNRGDSGFLQRFTDSQIQPWIDFFNDALSEGQRAAAVTTIERRVDLINQMSGLLERLDLLGGGNIVKEFRETTLEPLLTAFTSTTMGDSDRQNIITTLSRNLDNLTETLRKTEAMTKALERLKAIQKDLTAGVGADPLVARFKADRLDTIAKQLEDINLSEAERNRLIEQYRIEQEKILRIQEKQQQLTFLEQQLALIDKLRKLDEEEGFSIDIKSILSGIKFGVDASLDDLLKLFGVVIDETIRFTNQELGIASPSKVFAKIGGQIMDGLAFGIRDATMRPLRALNDSTRMMQLAAVHRTQQATLNMHIGSVNNGMDVQMLEARMQGWLDRQFAGI